MDDTNRNHLPPPGPPGEGGGGGGGRSSSGRLETPGKERAESPDGDRGRNKRARLEGGGDEWSLEEDEALLLQVHKLPRCRRQEMGDWDTIATEISRKFHKKRTAWDCISRHPEILTKEKEHEKKEKEDAQKKLEVVEKEKEHEKKEKELLARQKKNHSFESLMSVPVGKFKLAAIGHAQSATNGKTHLEAKACETGLPLAEFDPDEHQKIKDILNPSGLLSAFVNQKCVDQNDLKFQTIEYENESDVTSIVKTAVTDAIVLFKELFGERFKGECKRLNIRMERNLFSYRPDILVVLHHNTPFFAIEVKKPLPKKKLLKEAGHVLGQALDYALLLKASGLSIAFVAISTFEESVLCWQKTSEQTEHHPTNTHSQGGCSQQIDHNLGANALSPESKTNAAANETEEGESPSPPSLIDSPSWDGTSRELWVSTGHKPHELVLLLYTGLVKAMKMNSIVAGVVKKIFRLRKGDKYSFPSCLATSSTKTSYHWSKLDFTVGQPIRLQRSVKEPEEPEYYIIGILGYGSTSTVFQAIDSNGTVVAIKMYVKANILEIDDCQSDDHQSDDHQSGDHDRDRRAAFHKAAKEAATRETALFLKLYGDLLDGKVRSVSLFKGLYCVVMPFFVPVNKDKRMSRLQEVKEVLTNRFVKEKLMYAEDDIRWPHIGIYHDNNGEEHIILYDLADLVKLGDDKQMAERHCKVLEDRCGDEETRNAKMFAGTEEMDTPK